MPLYDKPFPSPEGVPKSNINKAPKVDEMLKLK